MVAFYNPILKAYGCGLINGPVLKGQTAVDIRFLVIIQTLTLRGHCDEYKLPFMYVSVVDLNGYEYSFTHPTIQKVEAAI